MAALQPFRQAHEFIIMSTSLMRFLIPSLSCGCRHYISFLKPVPGKVYYQQILNKGGDGGQTPVINLETEQDQYLERHSQSEGKVDNNSQSQSINLTINAYS